jgi:hypothetical protein
MAARENDRPPPPPPPTPGIAAPEVDRDGWLERLWQLVSRRSRR